MMTVERRKAERRAEAGRYAGGNRKRPADRRFSDTVLFGGVPYSVNESATYVRRSENPELVPPWQVRRNRPDETFEVLSEHTTEEGAVAALTRRTR